MRGEGIAEALRRVAELTPAQRATLTEVSRHDDAVSVAQVAQALGVQRSTARENLELLRESGLVERERLPVAGRGRPSWGYLATVQIDADTPGRMLAGSHNAVAQTLRETHPDPAAAAHAIGRRWADDLLADAVPDHGRHDESAYEQLDLAAHMGKIALFSSSLGFAATVDAERPTTLCLNACPFVRDGKVDPLICRMHLGLGERVVEATSRGRVGVTLRPWVTPRTCEVELTELPGV